MSLSSGGGLSISPVALPYISCVDGEYVPRVARARFTLLRIIRKTVVSAITNTHDSTMISISRTLRLVSFCTNESIKLAKDSKRNQGITKAYLLLTDESFEFLFTVAGIVSGGVVNLTVAAVEAEISDGTVPDGITISSIRVAGR